MTTLVFSAHPDDEIIGVGGTIALLSQKEDVIATIFSYGDKYPFWRPAQEVIRRRVNETKSIDKILGIKRTYFLGLRDMKVKDYGKTTLDAVKKLLLKYKPKRVFVHTEKDGHSDHRAVNRIVMRALKDSFIRTTVYTYDISFFNLSNGKINVVYDVSKTFDKKFKALDTFKSQKLIIKLLKPLIIFKAVYYGLRHGFKYGECFKGL